LNHEYSLANRKVECCMNAKSIYHASADPVEQRSEMEQCKRKLWDKFVTICNGQELNVSFNQLWYEFVARHYLFEETPIESIYEGICDKMDVCRNRRKFRCQLFGGPYGNWTRPVKINGMSVILWDSVFFVMTRSHVYLHSCP
jgi:hypothetical protein